MNQKRLGFAVTIASLALCAADAVSQVTTEEILDSLTITLDNPEDQIVTTTPLVLTIREQSGVDTHLCTILLSPNPLSSLPASGWFGVDHIDTDNDGTPDVHKSYFYLDQGYVYLWHRIETDSGGSQPDEEQATAGTESGVEAAMQPVTRPRVRTKRVLAQGEGTELIVQVLGDKDRVLALDGTNCRVDCVPELSNESAELKDNQSTTVTPDGNVTSGKSISEQPEVAQFHNQVMTQVQSLIGDVPSTESASQ